ncbi:unnamed protein product [Pocillopora meandrina]|uniref:Uncharacterized protein n=1 Tax=Pocillopora meandrina TaxID=46732 RepID=A0AAU9W0K7_9CNID|nr:unnamed protein product [Pocillopora meandrina]
MKCKKVGHYASVCQTKPSNDSTTANKSVGRKRGPGKTKYLEVVKEETEDDEVLGIFAVKDSGKDEHILIFMSELVLPLIVVDGEGPPLLGRNWLEQLKLNWHNTCHVSKADTV